MPVVVTRNQLTGLKLVNDAPFSAINIFTDLAYGTIALASDVALHLDPRRPFSSSQMISRAWQYQASPKGRF